ncbi:protein NRT1/ PTR FAMILY 5.5 isoform X2 [Quercus robur]|uniref:protein NRT1/ PTR FAMILY 5.5 isoform X2 n=1 Tax=Quercus robur TaxID=38942 RepID=UPI002163A826|nr:protein NRT1/ PTR FAMILY 5.5 isoform X2 [Quercus robur]
MPHCSRWETVKRKRMKRVKSTSISPSGRLIYKELRNFPLRFVQYSFNPTCPSRKLRVLENMGSFVRITAIMPIGMTFLVDAFMGDYWMLLHSSLAFSFGMGSLTMSTPPVLSDVAAGNCGAYKPLNPDCIGNTQKAIFYTALALVAIGISGHITSLESFLKQQQEDNSEQLRPWQAAGGLGVILLPIVACIALPNIKPWFVQFLIPAVCTGVATFLFTTGSCVYRNSAPQGSPFTTVCRVFVASASKMFHHLPPNDNQVPHTRSLRCLDKAAIVVETQNQEQNEKNRWTLCSLAEVEDTKSVVRMIPMWMTFIMCGVVISIGNTYFIEQAKDMNQKVGKWKIPLPIFKLFYDLVKDYFPNLYVKVTKLVIREKYIPPCGITAAMLFSILCCITAAEVETRRLDVVKRHGFDNSNDNNEKIPMSMFWLLPQFLLLGAVEGISKDCIDRFFTNQAPTSMKRYLQLFSYGVMGAGTVGSVLSVYVVGKVSGSVGKRSWFQDTLDKSQLDNYYWTLTVLSSANLILYILVAMFYTYKDPPSEEPTQP